MYGSHQNICPISQPQHISINMLLLIMNMQLRPIEKLGNGQYLSIDEEILFCVHSWYFSNSTWKKKQWKSWCASGRRIQCIKDKRHILKLRSISSPWPILSMVHEDYPTYFCTSMKKECKLNLNLILQICCTLIQDTRDLWNT